MNKIYPCAFDNNDCHIIDHTKFTSHMLENNKCPYHRTCERSPRFDIILYNCIHKD